MQIRKVVRLIGNPIDYRTFIFMTNFFKSTAFNRVFVASIAVMLTVTFSYLASTFTLELLTGNKRLVFGAGTVAFVITMSLIQTFLTKPDASDGQLQELKNERVIITKKIEEEKEADIFHTIQLSLNELNQYYTINKAQATTSFRFSIMAVVAGLAVIITGIILNYTGTKTIEITYLAGISGILLEFIGGAYFFMYKKSLEQVNFFFGQLIKVQDTMLAINLADAIKDDNKKSDMQEKIIVSLLERSLK